VAGFFINMPRVISNQPKGEYMRNDKEWYEQNTFVILFLIFIFPIGLYLVWRYTDWAKSLKIAVSAVIAILVIVAIFSPSNQTNNAEVSNTDNQQATQQTDNFSKPEREQSRPKTDRELIFEKVVELIESNEAFDTGSYIKGDVPVGEYAFISFDESGKYYSEYDIAGNIIDNENFDSFGYVYVHGAGNLQTNGILIKPSSFEKLGVVSAKEIYEKLNNIDNYSDSAMYKVGVDIVPGTYTIESYGKAYVEVMSGPVGKSDIVDNENFNGKYSVSVSAGQYLKVSRGKLL
jgi:hypothetical protein